MDYCGESAHGGYAHPHPAPEAGRLRRARSRPCAAWATDWRRTAMTKKDLPIAVLLAVGVVAAASACCSSWRVLYGYFTARCRSSSCSDELQLAAGRRGARRHGPILSKIEDRQLPPDLDRRRRHACSTTPQADADAMENHLEREEVQRGAGDRRAARARATPPR